MLRTLIPTTLFGAVFLARAHSGRRTVTISTAIEALDGFVYREQLLDSAFAERKAVPVLGYEHSPPEISLEPAVKAFELVARRIAGVRLGTLCEATSVA